MRVVSRRTGSRRGMAVLIVLALIAISLSLAYATMRTQATAEQIQANARHRGDARQVALSAMAIGLRKMHQSDWAGVGTTTSGSLSATDTYSVTYTTGDSDLTVGHPKYAEYPYRVTVVATGYSANLGTGSSATHRVRAVVKLVPRALSAAPTDWATVQSYTVYQRDDDDFKVHMPARIEGQVRIQSRLQLNKDYNNWTNGGQRYFSDLQTLFAGGSDYRPFTGKLIWDVGQQNAEERDWLCTRLALPETNAARQALASWRDTTPNTSYQLYPGGASYNVSTIGSDVAANTALKNDPLTNPLGIFYTTGSVRLWDNVTVSGTLVANGLDAKVSIMGNNVQVAPVDLPNITAGPLRLPTIVADDFFHTATGASIKGVVYADDEFEIDGGSQLEEFQLEGKLIARDIEVGRRSQWNLLDWGLVYVVWALLPVKPPYPLYADATNNADVEPRIVVKPSATTATYHWLVRGNPLYVVPGTDAGLMWDVVSWKDNP